MVSKSQLKATEKYNKKAYENIRLRVKAGKKEIIEQYAKKSGTSLNNYINNAIMEKLTAEGYQTEEQAAGRGSEPEKMP